MRLGSLSLTVAAFALLGGAGALACDERADVKGPVHITSRGVEFIDAYPGDQTSQRETVRVAVRIARAEAENSTTHEITRESLKIARAVADAARELTRELNQDGSEIARNVAEAARQVARELAVEHREITRQVAAAAREFARHQREVVKVARAAAREAARARSVHVYVQKAMLVARDALGQANDGLSEAERDLSREMNKLNAMVDGDFSDVIVERDGVVKCGDVSKHPGCEPLTEEDKDEIRETTQAALEQAQAGLEAAREGLEAAAEAMRGAD